MSYFRLKCTEFAFGLLHFRGPTSKGRQEREMEEEKGQGERWEGRERGGK